jgi:hypothetical protein
MWNFAKIRVGRIALLHAETHGRADMTKLMVAFAATLRTLPKIDACRRVICPCGSQRDGDCFPVTALNVWCHEEALCFL